jgi:hypothetical protein
MSRLEVVMYLSMWVIVALALAHNFALVHLGYLSGYDLLHFWAFWGIMVLTVVRVRRWIGRTWRRTWRENKNGN